MTSSKLTLGRSGFSSSPNQTKRSDADDMMDNATKMKQESTFKFKVFVGLCCLIIFTQIWYGINYPPQCQYEKVIVEKVEGLLYLTILNLRDLLAFK